MTKSPFLVYQQFLTSDECDWIAETTRVVPVADDEGNLQASERYHNEAEQLIFPKLQTLIPDLEEHYAGFTYRGTEHLIFQQFPVSKDQFAEAPHCENAVYKRKKWIRVKDRDLTGLLWLKDYQEAPPFDIHRQVLGGKLEFPVYNFGFQPQRGTLVIYPSNERFISHTSAILVAELQCVRIHICGEGTWLYDPRKYPGDFRTWFSDIV